MGRKKSKRIWIYILTLVLALSSAVAVRAGTSQTGQTTGGQTGQGGLEMLKSRGVFYVDVPVEPAEGTKTEFDFVVDPYQLIKGSRAARYGGRTDRFVDLEDLNLYFPSYGNSTRSDTYKGKFSNISNAVSINNLSSLSVDVILKAEIKGLDKRIKIRNSDTFTGNEPQLYMGLIVAEGDGISSSEMFRRAEDTARAIPIYKEGAKGPVPELSLEKTLKDNRKDYKIRYLPETDEYEMYYTGTITENHSLYFALTGACNPGGNWLGIDMSNTRVHVSWDIRPIIIGRRIKNPVLVVQRNQTARWYFLPGNTGSDVKNVLCDGRSVKTTFNYEADSIWINAGSTPGTRYYTVIYMDDTSEIVQVTVK